MVSGSITQFRCRCQSLPSLLISKPSSPLKKKKQGFTLLWTPPDPFPLFSGKQEEQQENVKETAPLLCTGCPNISSVIDSNQTNKMISKHKAICLLLSALGHRNYCFSNLLIFAQPKLKLRPWLGHPWRRPPFSGKEEEQAGAELCQAQDELSCVRLD